MRAQRKGYNTCSSSHQKGCVLQYSSQAELEITRYHPKRIGQSACLPHHMHCHDARPVARFAEEILMRKIFKMRNVSSSPEGVNHFHISMLEIYI